GSRLAAARAHALELLLEAGAAELGQAGLSPAALPRFGGQRRGLLGRVPTQLILAFSQIEALRASCFCEVPRNRTVARRERLRLTRAVVSRHFARSKSA